MNHSNFRAGIPYRFERLACPANQLPFVADGIKFSDGVAVDDAETRAA